MSRPIIVLEFNELCPRLMDRFISEGFLPSFKSLRDKSEVYITDAQEEGRHLEPWIQWVTVHTGMSLSQHKVFELGDAHKLKAPRLWDHLVDAGKSVWICSSMNATIRSPSSKTYFLPDPWSSEVKPLPQGAFEVFCRLAWKYVQEHARASAPWSKKDYAAFLVYMVRNGLSVKTVAKAFAQLSADLPNKNLRWRRAVILDRLQWDLFRHTWKRARPDFSTFFLNSTAHFQHYHWRDMEPHHYSNKSVPVNENAKDAIVTGYKAMDEIVGECMEMAPNAVIILMTALSQQPLLRYEAIGGKYIFKAIDPDGFLKFADVRGEYKYAPVMAEEFRIYFNNEADAEQAHKALSALTVSGRALISTHRNGQEVFGRCDVNVVSEPGELVRSNLHNQTSTFEKLFYQIGGAKSGGHHPDGIFWISRPGEHPVLHTEKLPLVEAAHMLAKLAGVKFDNKIEQKEALRAAS